MTDNPLAMYLDIDRRTRQRNDKESFLAAAAAGAVDTLDLSLDERGVNINTVDRFHQTALVYAIEASCEDCALYRLQRGIDWRSHNRRGLTALHLTAGMGRDAVVHGLINARSTPVARSTTVAKTLTRRAAQRCGTAS